MSLYGWKTIHLDYILAFNVRLQFNNFSNCIMCIIQYYNPMRYIQCVRIIRLILNLFPATFYLSSAYLVVRGNSWSGQQTMVEGDGELCVYNIYGRIHQIAIALAK